MNVRGPVDTVLDGELAEDVLAVVGEGITNAVKHSGGSNIAVAVVADERGITVTIGNDGDVVSTGRRSGLRNLEERATRRLGTMTLDAVDGRTVLTWTAPLTLESARSGRP